MNKVDELIYKMRSLFSQNAVICFNFDFLVADTPLPHTSASGLSNTHQHFFFALAYETGTILLIKLDAITGNSSTVELKQHYDALIMPRFISRALR